MGVVWTITLVLSCIAALVLIIGFFAADSAVQQGSIAAFAVGLVAIPYVFSRSLEALSLVRGGPPPPAREVIRGPQRGE